MSERALDDQMQQHTDALRCLVLMGWTATVIGDPCDPEALVYVHEKFGISDMVFVKSYDDAVATRTVLGHTKKKINGTVSDVVDRVMTWLSVSKLIESDQSVRVYPAASGPVFVWSGHDCVGDKGAISTSIRPPGIGKLPSWWALDD